MTYLDDSMHAWFGGLRCRTSGPGSCAQALMINQQYCLEAWSLWQYVPQHHTRLLMASIAAEGF